MEEESQPGDKGSSLPRRNVERVHAFAIVRDESLLPFFPSFFPLPFIFLFLPLSRPTLGPPSPPHAHPHGPSLSRSGHAERRTPWTCGFASCGYREAGRRPALRCDVVHRRPSIIQRHVPVIAHSACNITKHRDPAYSIV